MFPRHPGVLSALGLLATPLRQDYVRTCRQLGPDFNTPVLSEALQQLEAAANTWLDRENMAPEDRQIERYLDVRYPNQGHELQMMLSGEGGVTSEAMRRIERDFHDLHERLYGFAIRTSPVVGLLMGGFTIGYPQRVRSLVIAGVGYGAEKHLESSFRDAAHQAANQFETLGSEAFSHTYCAAAARIPLLIKDPRGWEEFRRMMGEHDSQGATMTMRGVQALRPSIYDLEEPLRNMEVPVLIVSGDEDDHCLQPGLFLKRTIPASGLAVLPKAGHTLNLEEPAMFNALVADFLAQVEQGRWLPRDPRSNPAEIVKTN